MKTVRRVSAASVAGILGLLVLASPAVAAEPTVTWTRPSTENRVLKEAGPITGTVEGDDGQDIVQAEFNISPEAPSNDPCFVEGPAIQSFPDNGPVEDFSLELRFPCNGDYTLAVQVKYSDNAITDILGSEPVSADINFDVAIPPVPVQGLEATYDEGVKETRLSWAPNGEADLLGYIVERNPPGPAGFSQIGPELVARGETSFIDTGVEDEFRYRIVAVRRGADDNSQIRSEPSNLVTAGPEQTQPTLPDDLPAPNSAPPSAGPRPNGTRTPSAPGTSGRTRTTSNIFEETLPFDPSQSPPPASDITEPDGDPSVVAQFDERSSTDRQRATLVPIAGGLALVMGAMHLFLLSKRAGEEEIPITRR